MPARTPGGPRAGEAARAHALAALRQAILSGDVAPGQRLVEEELAGTLGVTRQSLRAALLDLTAEGLVERIPNRGARVRTVTTDEAVAITECRMALEALCAAKAAERQPAEVLRAQPGTAPPGRCHLRAARRRRPARPAARPARPAPVPARAPARPPRGFGRRAPGHSQRDRRPASRRRRPRRPRPPGQRRHGTPGGRQKRDKAGRLNQKPTRTVICW